MIDDDFGEKFGRELPAGKNPARIKKARDRRA
jgi:hypothetical protein